MSEPDILDDWPGNYWDLGAFLLHQQCWCWGQDIRRAEGNLLLAYGFERTRPPEGRAGISRYRFAHGRVELFLWGFGVALRDQDCGAIYVNRYSFVPRWVDPGCQLDDTWRVEDLAGNATPRTMRSMRRTRRMLRVLVRSLARYEDWVLREYGLAYRRDVLSEWQRPAILPERMAREWEQMSWRVEDLPLAG